MTIRPSHGIVDCPARGRNSYCLRGAGREVEMSAPRGSIALAMVLALVLLAACARAPQPGDPVRGLDKKEAQRFALGHDVFVRQFKPQDGLGPLFNAASCGE